MTVTIKFWLMPNAGFESRNYIELELRRFREKHPRISVDIEILTWTAGWFRYINALKQKTGPDVIQVGTTLIAPLAYLGGISRLDDLRVREKEFLPVMVKPSECFGHRWALPWFAESRVLYYRKDILKRAGIDIRTLSTWDGFRAACVKIAKLREGGPKAAPFCFSAQKAQAIMQDMATWLWAFGGDFLTPDGTRSAIAAEPARRGFRFFLDLISSDLISDTSLELSTGEVAENFFLHDSYAFLLAGSWPLHVYLSPDSKGYVGKRHAEEFGVVPVPAGPAGRFNFVGGSALAATSFTRHPKEALMLVRYLTGKESMTRYCRHIKMLPTRPDAGVFLADSASVQDAFQKSLAVSGRNFPSHPLWGTVEQIMINGFAQTLRDFQQSRHSRQVFFSNLAEISREVDYTLSLFGE